MTLSQLLGLADILGPDRPDVRRGIQAATLDPQKIPRIHRHFLLRLRQEGYDLADLPVFPVGIRSLFEEGVCIGNIVRGNRICEELFLPVQAFWEHCLIAGQTGQGKSTLIKIIAPQLHDAGVRLWFFDSEDEYKDLIAVIPPGELLVIDVEDDRSNILAPPCSEISPREWIAQLKNLFREAFYLRDGSINLLDDVLTNVYDNHSVFDGSKRYPTVLDVYRTLEVMKFKPGTRAYNYLESLLNRFKGLLENMEKNLDCRIGFSPGDMLGKTVVYRMDLSSDQRLFFITYKMLEAEFFRKHHPASGIENIFVVDEAHKLYNPVLAKRADMGEPMIFTSLRTLRKRGIGFIFSDQIPSSLPPQLLGNVNVRIAMRLGHSWCINTMSAAMNFSMDQKEYLSTIPKRYSVLQSGEYPEPILIRIPEEEFREVSEDEVSELMDPIIHDLKYVPREERIDMTELDQQNGDEPGETKKPESPHLEPRRIRKVLLWDIVDYPMDGLTERFERQDNLNPWLGRKVVDELEQLGFIEKPVTVSMGKRGRGKKFLRITPAGADHIGVDFEDIHLPGKGSFTHKVFAHLIKESMEKAGKVAYIEHSLNGKSVDVAAMEKDQDGTIVAYEVELSPKEQSQIIKNLTADLEAGFDSVVIVCRNSTDLNRIKTKVYKSVDHTKLEKISFRLIREFA